MGGSQDPEESGPLRGGGVQEVFHPSDWRPVLPGRRGWFRGGLSGDGWSNCGLWVRLCEGSRQRGAGQGPCGVPEGGTSRTWSMVRPVRSRLVLSTVRDSDLLPARSQRRRAWMAALRMRIRRRQQRPPPLLPGQPSRVHSPAVARSTPVNFADFPPQAFRRPVQRGPWAAVPRREGASRCGGVDVHRRTHGVGVEGDDAAGGVIGQEALGRVHVVDAVDGPICPPTR